MSTGPSAARGPSILIVDSFDSFTYNLVDYLGRLGCAVTTVRNDADPEIVAELAPDLIVLSPGPSIPARAGNLIAFIDRWHATLPLLGVCLGHQALVEYFGGTIDLTEPLHGKTSPITHDARGIFRDLPQGFVAGRYHSWVATRLPDCLEVSAHAGDLVMAVRHRELPIDGVQFHPESVLTMDGGHGLALLRTWVTLNAPARA